MRDFFSLGTLPPIYRGRAFLFLATGRILCRLFYSFPARWWHRNIVRTGSTFNDFGKIVIIGTSGSTGRVSWDFG